MQSLAAADWLVLLIICFFILSAGFSLKPAITGSKEFLQAGRMLPAWLCGLAFAAAGLGLEASLLYGGIGARYGFESVPFALLGSVPAMLFTGLFLMPHYHGSNARTLPEYLALRFDEKMRTLTACLILVTTVAGAALSLYAMARIFAALHVFDEPLRAAGLDNAPAFVVTMTVPMALILAYVLLGGLAGAMYNMVLQFFVITAGLLPVVLLGLKQIGGWRGLKTAAALAGSSFAHSWNGSARTGITSFALAAVIGLVSGFTFWCTDFRVLQTAMAAKNTDAARRAPLIAAAVWLLLPLLFILPSIVALGMPTPHTSITVRNENGAIYHDITVVASADEAGQGLVPAMIDPATGKPMQQAPGRNLLNGAQATPNLITHLLPMGLLGLGIATLLACMMSSVAAGVTAFSAVFTCDLYQARFHKTANDGHLLLAGRLAAAGGGLLAVGAACAAYRWSWNIEGFAAIFLHFSAPLLTVILLGVFYRRITAHGAFAGLAAGIVITLLPSIVVLPIGSLAPLRQAWLDTLQGRGYQNGLALTFWTGLAAAAVSLTVALVVSLSIQTRPAEKPAGLVSRERSRKKSKSVWWQKPEALAGAILLAAIAITLIFA